MKGDPKVIAKLNDLLAAEHAAYIQYSTHARMVANWGYEKLVEYLTKRANDEKEHANELLDRILFLEGLPTTVVSEIKTGDTVLEMFPLDKEAEIIAVADYCEGIEIAVACKDFGTRKLLEHILEEEERHLNDIEANVYQITNSGLDDYLAVQIGG